MREDDSRYVTTVFDIHYRRTHSRFRKGLESDVTRDVNEVLDLLNCGLVKEAGNEQRRTKRTASVIQVIDCYNNEG